MVMPLGTIIGYFIATIYVGYTVGGEYRNGADHGAIVGVITGIIAAILLLIQINPIQLEAIIGGTLILFALSTSFAIILNGIIGAIGGIIGAFIKGSRSSKESTA